MALLKKSVWMILVFLPLLAIAQRLPFGLSAKHYALTFTPDLQKAIFTGDETLDVEVNKAFTELTLNAIDLEFQEATITPEREDASGEVELCRGQRTGHADSGGRAGAGTGQHPHEVHRQIE